MPVANDGDMTGNEVNAEKLASSPGLVSSIGFELGLIAKTAAIDTTQKTDREKSRCLKVGSVMSLRYSPAAAYSLFFFLWIMWACYWTNPG